MGAKNRAERGEGMPSGEILDCLLRVIYVSVQELQRASRRQWRERWQAFSLNVIGVLFSLLWTCMRARKGSPCIFLSDLLISFARLPTVLVNLSLDPTTCVGRGSILVRLGRC
jgi:hypothetical protein